MKKIGKLTPMTLIKKAVSLMMIRTAAAKKTTLDRNIFDHMIGLFLPLCGYVIYFIVIAYQNKKHIFNWLNTLYVTFTIP